MPFDTTCLACKGDPIANLQEDLAAEQKARATYEKLIDGEALRGVQDKLAERKFYTSNCNEN